MSHMCQQSQFCMAFPEQRRTVRASAGSRKASSPVQGLLPTASCMCGGRPAGGHPDGVTNKFAEQGKTLWKTLNADLVMRYVCSSESTPSIYLSLLLLITIIVPYMFVLSEPVRSPL